MGLEPLNEATVAGESGLSRYVDCEATRREEARGRIVAAG